MFISIEKAILVTGKSKNALYRQMAKGHINFVRCTKGKRFLEVAELRRLYGELLSEPAEPTPDSIGQVHVNNDELLAVIGQLALQLKALDGKVDKQSDLIESLMAGAPQGSQPAAITTAVSTTPVVILADSPERDPDWPPFITCYADLAKRDEIKAKYAK
ncbi:MAG: hypothetical protein HRT35_19640 [Algicola sp.]|nr:hypothetical protein [Algicola sp.]